MSAKADIDDKVIDSNIIIFRDSMLCYAGKLLFFEMKIFLPW